MHFYEIIIIAIGLSMDAFAAALCRGLSAKRIHFKHSVITGLYFGVFQALMPVIGFYLGFLFSDLISAVDHWIAFVILVIIGAKMIFDSCKKESNKENEEAVLTSDREFSAKKLFPLAVATSIDALAVGVSLAFLTPSILPAALTIGIITLILSAAGVYIGNLFGSRLKGTAEFFGGLVLVLIATKILLEHLGILTF